MSIAADHAQPLEDVIDPPRAVYERTSLSSTTVWRLRRAGQFPEPIVLSPGRKGWRRGDITAWLDGRRSERGA
jgi:prophage regulatory protein